MLNEILDTFYEGNNFVGYLAVDHEGCVLFGYEADWAQANGYSLCGENHTGYMLRSFESEAEARKWLAEQNFR